MEAARAPAQAEPLSFLSEAETASYPHRPDRVDVLQTHASYVALAGPLVIKVKKPLDFGLLDFSTLGWRLHFCQEEVRLNRRLCPHLYEAVVPIRRRRAGDRQQLGPGGTARLPDGEGEGA